MTELLPHQEGVKFKIAHKFTSSNWKRVFERAFFPHRKNFAVYSLIFDLELIKSSLYKKRKKIYQFLFE